MIFLDLFHGRKNPSQDMDDMGEPGPVFVSEHCFHTTYGSDIKFEQPSVASKKFHANQPAIHRMDCLLYVVGDCVYYNGMYYGDWSVFHSKAIDSKEDLKRVMARLVPFDDALAEPPVPAPAKPNGPAWYGQSIADLTKQLVQEIGLLWPTSLDPGTDNHGTLTVNERYKHGHTILSLRRHEGVCVADCAVGNRQNIVTIPLTQLPIEVMVELFDNLQAWRKHNRAIDYQFKPVFSERDKVEDIVKGANTVAGIAAELVVAQIHHLQSIRKDSALGTAIAIDPKITDLLLKLEVIKNAGKGGA